ncbi:MAG: N-6 DNA methylase [Candidatus Magasanikbacteria bacterium]|nr:N-6 DNA methylase [Candidatus Magasanikbacteria bacterium]
MQKEAGEKIKNLVAKYEAEKAVRKISKYSEEETKRGFIEPLFQALGWDFSDKREVTLEEQISGDRVDYGFYLNNRIKFYLEAKKISADLHREDYAKQSIRYSWNKGVTWAVLTDFESVIVFNALSPEKTLAGKRYFEIPYNEYLDRFDQLWLLSKEAFLTDNLDKEAEKGGKKLQKVSVTEKLAQDLNRCRKLLTEAFATWNKNKNVPEHLIDEGVQRLLDRLIFIRVAEDRKIEPPTLIPLIHQWKSGGQTGKTSPYNAMVEKFRQLDKIYNSNLFSEHPFEGWEEFSGATEQVVNILYGDRNYCEYDFSAIPADVLGAVYENYLGYRLEQTKKKLFDQDLDLAKDKRKRKEQGIYYTPRFIVDYIVQNALGPILDKCRSVNDLQKIKVLDPACGSGSFLVAAMNFIIRKYEEFGAKPDGYLKIKILQSNIYGVDLDEQAVELARLNLLLNTFDAQIKLPGLENNIKNGNSLISGTDEELKKFFGKNYRDKKPFNWQEEFPEVFKQGGFDCVIGNPPYLKELDNKELFREIKKSNFGKYYQGKMDFWYFFLHRSIEILKDSGMMAFITNSYFLKSAGATKLIDRLQDESVLIKAVDFQDMTIFEDVSGRHLIHIWQKTKDKGNAKTKYIKIDKNSFSEIIDDNKYKELSYAEVIKNSSINFETNRNIQNGKNFLSLGDLYDVSQGVVEGPDKVNRKNALKYGLQKGDGVFIVNSEELKNLNLNEEEKSFVKKYLDTKDVSKYSISHNREHLLYINRENCPDISRYPNLGKHLVRFKNIMDNRRETLKKSNQWFQMHWPRDNKYFESPKLICKGMFLSPEFCFDNEKFYVGFSFSVIIQKNKDYDLKYLLGLLNSSYGENWFNANGKKRGVGVDIGVAAFRNFPVHKASKSQQKQIVVLVDKMLILNKELKEVVENSDQWKKIKDEIVKTDKKIDEEVYKLYGLTEEEIGAVEQA